MHPEGHARSTSRKLGELLDHKFRLLASLAVDDVDALWRRFSNLAKKSPQEIAGLYDFSINGISQGT
jgi:hypothetical protein